MPATIELTLQELAKIALGTPELTHVNIQILHCLINMILKKLECRNEKIPMCGLEGMCLEKMLGASKPPTFTFNDEQLELISTKLDRIIELAEHVANTAEKLEKHFHKFDQGEATQPINVDLHNWDDLVSESQAHIDCDEITDLKCRLLNFTDFNMKVMRRLINPSIDRLFILEELAENLNKDLEEFLKLTADQYEKTILIDGCIIEMGETELIIDKYYLKFLGTMEEVQEMIDFKVDKIRVPAIKRYINGRLNATREMMGELQVHTDCPKEPGIIKRGIKCLSCGGTKICFDVGVHSTGLLPDWDKKKFTKLKKPCKCRYASQIQYEEPIEKPKLFGKIGKPSSCKRACFDIQLFEGTDGTLYRKG